MNVAGSKGYDAEAEALVRRYERVRPLDKYRATLHLIPHSPCRVMDVGAGSGADAAWFAALGHQVIAVEPTFELRTRAMALHPSPRIEWIDDSLPQLRCIVARGERFDLIAIAGVWTHLDQTQRVDAVRTVAALLSPGGAGIISIRQGNAPAGRLTFPAGPREAIACAEECGLRTVLDVEVESLQAANRAAGVRWAWLAFRK